MPLKIVVRNVSYIDRSAKPTNVVAVRIEPSLEVRRLHEAKRVGVLADNGKYCLYRSSRNLFCYFCIGSNPVVVNIGQLKKSHVEETEY